MSVNYKLKTIEIIGERKAFYKQRSRESSFAKKETVDIDILITSRDDNRKIMKSIRITIGPLLRITKWSQLSQFK